MYAIFISAALAIYTIILVDFSLLYKDLSASQDLLGSAQALYTAEGAVEVALAGVGDQEASLANLTFIKTASADEGSSEYFLTYNEGVDSTYLHRQFRVNEPLLDQASASLQANREAHIQGKELSLKALEEKAYYGLEPKTYKSFVLREVQPENHFNEVRFAYNTGEDASDLMFDVFRFPKESDGFEFQNFQQLKDDPSSNLIKRMVINTADESAQSFSFENQIPLQVEFGNGEGVYQKTLMISGFQPLEYNYILAFQTLDNQATHFKLSAFYQGKAVVLPNFSQTIDVIGSTSTGLYQRIKYQRQAEEGLAPGYNFVHFAEESIVK